ncbi:MAG: universal stress protein [Pseudomonadota bacterium]
MTVRSIVCLHSGYAHEMTSLNTAVSIAKDLGAHLKILHAAYVAHPTAFYFGESAALGAGWQEAVDKQMQAELDAARQSAQTVCAAHGLTLSEEGAGPGPQASFSAVMGYSERALIRELSICDLVVLGALKGSSSVMDGAIANLALFATARPVLIVRQDDGDVTPKLSGGVCAVAWNNSPEAIHALVHGRDLILAAREVHILSSSDDVPSEPTRDQAIALNYLAAHGVTAQLSQIAHGDKSDAEAVLAKAQELGCDYLVMGGYGHSMFREMLLGGFSETMLEQADFPLMLCH